jgi:hypothetical protein
MSVEEGQTVNFTESPREIELALTNTQDPTHDRVYSIPASLLSRSEFIEIPGSPIAIRVKRYFKNAALNMRGQSDPPSIATTGIGTDVKVGEIPSVVSDNEMNQPAAFVEPMIQGQSCGVWLVSTALGEAQTFSHDGQPYSMIMQPRRDYLPYAITLKRFQHDVYPGTDIPKTFSSLVHLSNPSKGEERDVLISMNQPLRYEGRTYYQASYGKDGKLSVLQVVRNPGWLLPYLSCSLITLGLLIHFGLTLGRSLKQRRAE